MKKIILLIVSIILLSLLLARCTKEDVSVTLPFEIKDIQSVELYSYSVPSNAQKRIVTDKEDIKNIFELASRADVKDKKSNDYVGASVISLRFILQDKEPYELIYISYGVKNGRFASKDFNYFTISDLSSFWYKYDKYNTEVAKESGLPKIDNSIK